MTEQVRVLLISFNALSKEGANGRTLECLLNAVDFNHLAQLYMSEEQPDFSVCNRFFQITDQQVLRSFFKRGDCPGRVVEQKQKSNQTKQDKSRGMFGKIASVARKYKRSSVMKLFRNFVWKKVQWYSPKLKNWIDEFDPQVVVMMSGKSEYFHDVARTIAQQRNIPLVVYHCEDYYFKNTHPYSLFYQCYRKGLARSMQRVMDYASLALYNSPFILKMYAEEFNTPGEVAYMASDLDAAAASTGEDTFIISYLGNLANKRYESLKVFADALYKVKPDAKINVYGPPLAKEVQGNFAGSENVEFKGLVSYEDCKRVMHESDMLLHVESFSPEVVEDLKIAFSTKIADCLSSGVCFFVYAPDGIAATEYLKETNAACLVTDPVKLEEKLTEFVSDSNLRQNYVNRALQVAATNHNKQLIGKRVLDSIIRTCK